MFFNILNQFLLFIFGLFLLAIALNNIEDPFYHKWGIILPFIGAMLCAACIIYNMFQR